MFDVSLVSMSTKEEMVAVLVYVFSTGTSRRYPSLREGCAESEGNGEAILVVIHSIFWTCGHCSEPSRCAGSSAAE